MSSSHISGLNFLIVGLVRDCADQILTTIQRLESAFCFANKMAFLLVESDSSDNSIQVLSEIASKHKSFSFETLGSLRSKYPKRADRIAKCRNHYLELIKTRQDYEQVDYVVVADFDGVNSDLTEQSVKSCWERDDWTVCAANQAAPYYDIWALRHTLWSPNDCWEQARFLERTGLSHFRSVCASVYSRMINIPPSANWIEVDSAFGGLAIYRKSALENVCYRGLDQAGEEVCEHVSLHEQIRSQGGRIFINPAMINAGLIEHARYATTLGLVRFWFRCQLRALVVSTGMLQNLKRIRRFV